ncbi:MAG: TIM44-like domain-containing protein [Pseudobdellovibrio sp.]
MKKILLSSVSLLLFVERLWARAGGAGGGHSGGGGGFGGGGFHSSGGGFGHSTYYSSGSGDGGDLGVILFFIVIVVIFIIVRSSMSRGRMGIPSGGFTPQTPMPDVPNDLLSPGDKIDFGNKVKTAFLTIQQAWSEKRLDTMRRFISDGVYQRFNAQYLMMNKLGQTNVMSDVSVRSQQVVKAYHDGLYDCIDVAVTASAFDQFVCEKYPQMNSPGGMEQFTEYWSFIRRRDYQKGFDIFHSENCPKCSAPLTAKLIETARCPYCNTYLNHGEYDWVLAEITQEDDYVQDADSAHAAVDEAKKVFPDFSKQLIEDRASNAMMQILIGKATRNVNVLKRFCTATCFEKLKAEMPVNEEIYNRLYTQSVDLFKTQVQDKTVKCHVMVKYSYESLEHFGQPIPQVQVVTLLRQDSGVVPKGSIFANACPSCGAAQKDSLSSVCSYCNSPLNDEKIDWVVDDIKDMTSKLG